MTARQKLQVLVEGWRGINQSYAMVNQFQLLEMVKLDGMEISHLDVAFAKPTWNPTTNNPGFPAHIAEAISRIPGPSRDRFDVVYRIASPFDHSVTPADKHVTFMTSEFGLSPVNFMDQNGEIGRFIQGRDSVVVPSRWSREKLIEYGFPAEKVDVVSHGVSAELFHPATAAERLLLRQSIGIRPDDFVFLNLGAMTWNKGLDVLLRGFSAIRERHPNAVLVLKDDPNLYGIGAATVVNRMMVESGFRLSDDVRNSIKLISVTLSLANLRLLYGAADAYVSPYRAEGFNLPVIESIACGTPVIVTRGGATDDFCEEATTRFIASSTVENKSRGIDSLGHHLEPDPESLEAHMEAALRGEPMPDFETGRQRVMERLSWSACVEELARILAR